MIVVTRTGEHTIYKKRNQRYAVRDDKTKQWVRGDDKVAILLAHNLIEASVPKAPEHPEEPEALAGGEAEAAGSGEAAPDSAEGGSEESTS
jgi:hypothetical protein